MLSRREEAILIAQTVANNPDMSCCEVAACLLDAREISGNGGHMMAYREVAKILVWSFGEPLSRKIEAWAEAAQNLANSTDEE